MEAVKSGLKYQNWLANAATVKYGLSDTKIGWLTWPHL